ncbi:Csu type fimbrial protein [Neisseria sicca]|uniref:Csu type fimbrial protein n=1 Tax=Neisseria sicca TaxID=490 RepID=UPI0004950A59|nr:spore coat protein U domain-containing protein [Neisseria sicca]
MQINIKRGRLKTANRLFRQMTLPAVFGLLSLSAGQTWANSGVAGRFVQCTATVQGNGTFKGHPALVFGSQSNGINLLNNNQPEDIQATIHYQCINNDNYTVKVRLCFNIDGGRGFTNIYAPRKMVHSRNNAQTLQLSLLKPDNTNWGTNNTANSPSSVGTGVMRIAPNTSESGTIPIRARLVSGQSNTIPTTASDYYIADFTGGSTALSWKAERYGTPDPSDCGNILTNNRFSFYVQAHVAPVCEFINAYDIDFGTHTAGSTNLKQSRNLTVRCTNGTPYTVGLIPSNGNQEGRGEMKSTNPANTDKVPYRLRKGTYATAPFWGNKPSAPGKAQEFLGDGSSQTHIISAEVQNTDYTPGEYKDKVAVDIRY